MIALAVVAVCLTSLLPAASSPISRGDHVSGRSIPRPAPPASRLTADSLPTITLADALQRSVQLNPDYVRALGAVAEADWIRKASRLAFFIPAVTANIDLTKYSVPFFNLGTGAPVNTSVTATLAARYEIFSIRKFTELGRSQAELEFATATEVQRRFAAALLTESAYYAALADEELARVARDRASRAEQQLVVARARVQTGAAAPSDSLIVRLELLRARVTLLRDESALRVSRLELGRRVGVAGAVVPLPLDSAPAEALPLALDAAVAQALEQGPEYRAARARERAADKDLSGKRGGYLPTLTLDAAHVRFDSKFFPSAVNVSSLTFTLALPIWDNGRRELSIIQARATRDVARAVRSDLELAAQREVTEAYDGFETARAESGLALESRAVAIESYRVQEARYRAGATTVLELLQAQNDLSQAEATLVQSRFTARLALARLEAILGTRFNSSGGPS
ncbi:MAG: TolC family protein [Gemmatimonadota bacterium]|nr:TolC family protein [Gemmatimonadota bacterium]